jgi:hypothetical protein
MPLLLFAAVVSRFQQATAFNQETFGVVAKPMLNPVKTTDEFGLITVLQ